MLQGAKSLGNIGETLASTYLQKKGYHILFRNYRTRWDELDIIASKSDKLVFFEVKTKKSLTFSPYEALTKQKIEHLSRAITYFLLQNKYPNIKLSVDVIGIV